MYGRVLSKQTFKCRNTSRHTTRGREGAGSGGYTSKKKKVIFVCISKMNFWAYLSRGDADIRDQTASGNIETVNGGQKADVICLSVCGGGDLR